MTDTHGTLARARKELLLQPFPPLQLPINRLSDEVGTLFAFLQNGIDALKGALRKACRGLLVVDLFPAHDRRIDDITNCFKPQFNRYHLLRSLALLISSKYQQWRRTMATIEHRDGIWLLTIPGTDAPMGFFSRESAVSFATNNLRLAVRP